MSEKNVTNVDQIRDLIFGAQIKDFEEKFKQLNHAVKTMEEKMTNTFLESHTKLQRETERGLEALERRLDNLSASTHREKVKLRELIGTTDEVLRAQINDNKDEFTTKLKVFKENAVDENQKTAESMRLMKIEIRKTLEQRLSTLSEEKLSRDSMAQMLLDVAMQIQGTDMSTMLIEEKKTGK